MDDANKHEEPSLARLGRDLQALAADVEELLRASAGAPGEELATVRSRLERTLGGVRARLAGVTDRVHAADRHVRENPWGSVAVAGGLALLIGMLMARRRAH